MLRRPWLALLLALALAGSSLAGASPFPQESDPTPRESTDDDTEARSKEEKRERRQARKARKAASAASEGAATESQSGEAEVEADDSMQAESGDEEGESESGEGSEEAAEEVADSDEAGVNPDEDRQEPDAEPSEEGEASESEDDADADEDADSDRPARLLISTDAACRVYVDGVLEGTLEPGEELEVGVDLGAVPIRASAVEMSRAMWEKTLEFEEEGQVESVRVRMKKAIRQQRQEERQTGVFRDKKTHLMWLKRDNGRDVDLRGAYAYCRDLDVGGLDGWRLPTLEELQSIQSLWLRAQYKIKGEILLTECCMWSTDYDGSERAWTFNYRFRKAFETNAGYQLGLRALCVRDWDPELEGEGEEEQGKEQKAKEVGAEPVEDPESGEADGV